MTTVKRRVFGENLIASALVAVGALMFVAGLYGIATGSRIVQVEAGWTSVIAGSVLLVGGVLTISLGFVLRALLQLKSSLQIQASTPLQAHSAPPQVARIGDAAIADLPTMREPADVPAHVDEPTLADEPTAANEPAFADEPIAATPAVADPPPALRPSPLRPSRTEPATPKAPLRRPSFFRKKASPAAETDTAAEIAPANEPLTSSAPQRGAAAELDHAPVVDEVYTADVHEADLIEAPHPADDFKIDKSPAHASPPSPSAQVPALSAVQSVDEGWLDRALADIHEATPTHELEHTAIVDAHSSTDAPAQEFDPHDVQGDGLERRHSQPAYTEPEQAYDTVEHTDAALEQPPAMAPSLPPAPTLRAAPAVIGRYEADGTSYVMYADGSIEAHSEAGIYRFASMTELKAFMEA